MGLRRPRRAPIRKTDLATFARNTPLCLEHSSLGRCWCVMGEDASRFRGRANQCRELSSAAFDMDARRTLNEMADDLEAEADRLDAEEIASKIVIGPKRTD